MYAIDKNELREAFDFQSRVERHPYGMLAGAAGVGFLLGGGLFTPLAGTLLGTAARIGLVAALPVLQRQVVRAIADAAAGFTGNGGKQPAKGRETANESARGEHQ